MPTPRSTRPGRFLITRRFRAALLAVALVLTLGLPVGGLGGAAAAPDREVDAVPTAPDGDAARSEARVTLLTGDVVAWHRSPSGQQGASVVVPAVEDSPPAVVYEQDGQMHVVPAEALPYVQSGAVDESLFNVTLLVNSQLDDASSSQVPLLLQGRGGPEARRAPATPDEASKVQVLDSVGMVAVDGPKDEIRKVWESLRGDPADLTATDARLAGAGKVWLNGTVRATLEDSVPQIDAPEAWAQGLRRHRRHRRGPRHRRRPRRTRTWRARSRACRTSPAPPRLQRTTTATAPTSRPRSPAPARPPAAARAPASRRVPHCSIGKVLDAGGARVLRPDHRRDGVGRAQRRRRGQHEPGRGRQRRQRPDEPGGRPADRARPAPCSSSRPATPARQRAPSSTPARPRPR